MKLIHSFRVAHGRDADLLALVAEHLAVSPEDIADIRIVKKSLDARNRRRFFWVYSLKVFMKGEEISPEIIPFPRLNWSGKPPLIIGAGPAGLFAAWTFLQHGIRPILLERGERTTPRMRKISRYWRVGELDPDSNVCNGEGGAGTFSDGKLITRIKSPFIPRIMQALVDYGAPEEITYVYNPHVGSNFIREVIRKMSDDLIARGGDLRFQTRVERLHLEKNQVRGVLLSDGSLLEGNGLILACGHSAGSFFETLADQGVPFEPKSFALGLRIEHPQTYINQWQYGNADQAENFGAAQYKLQAHWERESLGVYSFCMCPGGYVISSTTDPDTTVVNGMSNYHRNSPWANAAIVCSVPHDRVPGSDPFKLMRFQREIERRAFQAAGRVGPSHRIPVQHLDDFLSGREGRVRVRSSSPSGVVPADLSALLPDWITSHLREGLLDFEKRRRGFLSPEALLHGVESRTSSPVRIPRNSETMECLGIGDLYPCGEGPGYAGGITSAAADGMKAALAWIQKFIR